MELRHFYVELVYPFQVDTRDELSAYRFARDVVQKEVFSPEDHVEVRIREFTSIEEYDERWRFLPQEQEEGEHVE